MKIGILGGSFDPIHIAHLIIAQDALWQCELDFVLFIVNAHPPHKKEPEADAENRYRMVELATAGHPRFKPSRIEIERGGESYTAETLKELLHLHPGAALYLIVGADSALDFSAWKNPEAVIEMAHIVVAPRPGSDLANMEPRLRGKTQIIQSPALELSSTLVRTRVHEGKPIRFLVPDAVERHIRSQKLYAT